MVEVDLEPRIADPLDHLGRVGEEAVVVDRLVVEGRQQQDAAAAEADRPFAQGDGIGQGAAARARHQPRGRNAAGGQFLEQPQLFVDGQRVALAGGPEDREAGRALVQKGPAMRHETTRIRCQLRVVGRQRRHQHA